MKTKPKRSELLQRSGHAGGHLRDGLLNALDHGDDWWKRVEIDFYSPLHEKWWEKLSDRQRARWLIGQLWSCSDILPSVYASEIEDRAGGREHRRTYAALVRLLKQELEELKQVA